MHIRHPLWKLIVGFMAIGTIITISGCTNPTPTAAPKVIVETLAVTNLPALPPTWTPAPTLTPLPTSTPFPTATTTPTLSTDQLCQSFKLISAPAANAAIAYDGAVTFTWLGVPSGTTLTVLLTLHGSKAGLRADIGTPGDSAVAMPMLRLPSEGAYDWQMWLQATAHPEAGQLCLHSGTFTRLPLVMM